MNPYFATAYFGFNYYGQGGGATGTAVARSVPDAAAVLAVSDPALALGAPDGAALLAILDPALALAAPSHAVPL